MNLQLESICRRRTTQELQILMMDEHPENDQGQQPRGRRRGCMVEVYRGKTEEESEEAKDRGAADEIRATIKY